MKTDSDITTNSFHPTLSFIEFLKYIIQSFKSQTKEGSIKKLFPNTTTALVDSGRSAFALVVEHLDLSGKTLILPAYVCDAFLPVLIHYKIKPIFLDVDIDTYQPPLHSYTDGVLNQADAVVLVATYGKKLNQKVVSHLLERGKVIIEDYAMRSPLINEPLIGTARIYSLPKTLPVPDGGLAIISNNKMVEKIPPSRFSVALLKNILKLIPHIAPIIASVRDTLKHEQVAPKWNGIRGADSLTKVILEDYRGRNEPRSVEGEYSYCYPLLDDDTKESVTRLRQQGIPAERIWCKPIVLNTEACKRYEIDVKNFPITCSIAGRVICAPLWHIENKLSYEKYASELEEILANSRSK